MDKNLPPQTLTHDEKKAAEAAFAGRPFNPKWSEHARVVYDGILKALPEPAVPSQDSSGTTETTITPGEPVSAESAARTEESPAEETDPDKRESDTLPTRIPFEQALATGALIDVTSTAKQLGFSFPVTVTKPLWEVGIAPSKTLTQEEQSNRLRDVLMAFRLRLATQSSISPLIDFPALLALPPGSVPQPIPLFALIQPDEQNRAMVTLLLPNEVAATIIPMN
jgi:hypothetical protein